MNPVRVAIAAILMLSAASCSTRPAQAPPDGLISQTLVFADNKITLLSIGPLVKQYELTRDDPSVEGSEYYEHYSGDLGLVVSWVRISPASVPHTEDAMHEVFDSIADEQSVDVDYTIAPRTVAGIRGFEGTGQYVEDDKEHTVKAIMWSRSNDAWLILLFFTAENPEAHVLAEEIFQSVRLEGPRQTR
jgi:hypothetical protein